MINIAEARFIEDIGQALSDFGTGWEFTTEETSEVVSPVGEQLYAQMLGLDECPTPRRRKASRMGWC